MAAQLLTDSTDSPATNSSNNTQNRELLRSNTTDGRVHSVLKGLSNTPNRELNPIAVVTSRNDNDIPIHTGKCNKNVRSMSTTSDKIQNARIAHLHKSRMKLEKDVIITTGIIIFFVTLLSIPFQCMVFLESFEIVDPARRVRVYVTCLSFLKSALNPWLYAWRISHTRNELGKMCLSCLSVD